MKRFPVPSCLVVAHAGLLAVALSAPVAAQVVDTTDVRSTAPRATLPPGVADRVSYRESKLRESKLREARERMAPKPVIGVVLAQDAERGVAIAAVTPGSAAADAGLRTGDRLVAIDGHPLLGTTGALRVVNARKLLAGLDTDRTVTLRYLREGQQRDVRLAPRMSDRVVVWVDGNGREISTRGDVVVMDREAVRQLRERGGVPGVAPDIRREVVRLDDATTLLEAFRWNGLNLATVGKELGRYFGTERGVLVLSAGPHLDALRPGDVIRKVGETPVATPRDAMDALRGLSPGSVVTLDVLRDRKATRARVTVPEALPALPLAPPAPPAPPPPPPAPAPPRASAPPAVPPAPPAPPAPSLPVVHAEV